jgi:hypothetical protein
MCATNQIHLLGGEERRSEESRWRIWQLQVLRIMHVLLDAFRCVAIAAPEAAASDIAAVAATASSSNDDVGAAAADSHSSSNSQQVKWGYLLRLRQSNPQWAAALAAYEAKQQLLWEDIESWPLPSSAAGAAQLTQHCTAAVELCRALAAAAPITVVCNNPSCESLAGVSEAAAACKACTGCGCRYCCVACQRADWKRHTQACRLMAAAGESCA